MYQVLIENHDGEKEWECRTQKEVCEDIYLDASSVLESEADEETRYGSKFLDFQDKIKASIEGEDNKREYNEQLQKIHYVITSWARGARGARNVYVIFLRQNLAWRRRGISEITVAPGGARSMMYFLGVQEFFSDFDFKKILQKSKKKISLLKKK